MGSRTRQGLEGDIDRAIQILELFTDPKKRDVQMLIPSSVLRNAQGLVFIRLLRGGFVVSAKKGTGVVIARLPDGKWSAPSGVSMSAVGFGHQAGVEVIDSIITLNDRRAVKAFLEPGSQLQLGANLSVSAGPLGRAANVSAGASSSSSISATYAYSASKGLFAGYSFEGSKISERVNTNAAFYGRSLSAAGILTGCVAPPPQAQRLYQILGSLISGPAPQVPSSPQNINVGPNPLALSPGVRPTQQQQQHYQQQQQQQHQNVAFNEPPPPYVPAKDSPAASGYPGDNKHAPISEASDSNINGNQPVHSEPIRIETSNQQQASSYNPDSAKSYQSSGHFSPHLQNPPYYSSNRPAEANQSQGPQPYSPYNSSSQLSGLPQSQSAQHQGSYVGGNSGAAPAYSGGAPANFQPDMKAPSAWNSNSDPQQQYVVIAKYPYVAQQPGDLSFNAGDHIIVTRRLGDRNCWWEGQIEGRSGKFPANYTDDL